MNNIKIANETIEITKAGQYQLDGRTIKLTTSEPEAVKVYSPDAGAKLLEKYSSAEKTGDMCSITVTTEDSYAAASRFEHPLVMNFANAHSVGGGFRLGANAQEEALCRCSTLYASISSDAASEMYKYNNTHINAVDSDYMLLSDNVCVFRDHKCNLTDSPFSVGVITLPAPNKRGAAIFASGKKINETILRRIRIMLCIAAENGYRSLILGAWGCGAFGNSPDDVSKAFRTALLDDGLGRYFSDVCFAIYGPEDGKNFLAFRNTFPE